MSDLYLFRNALRDLLRVKKLVAAALLIAIPTLIALIARYASPEGHFNPAEVYNALTSGLVFNFILVILAVVFGTGVITQEIEQKTIVYLLTRPMPRWRIVLMKFLAAVTVTLATSWIACLLLVLVCYGGMAQPEPWALKIEQVKKPRVFMTKLKETSEPALLHIHEKLSSAGKQTLDQYDPEKEPTNEQIALVLSELNQRIRFDRLYDAESFAEAKLSEKSKALLAKNPTGREQTALNRSLLQDLFPEEIDVPGATTTQWQRDLLILPIGALAYGALFLLMATLMNRPLIYGLLFAFGWESWVPNLPGSFQQLSLMAYLKVLTPRPEDEQAAMNTGSILMKQVEKEIITTGRAWTVLVGAIVVCLGMALMVFSNREYVPREDTE